MKKNTITHPSFEMIHNVIIEMAMTIQNSNSNIGCIVGLTRGGLFPAAMLSHLLDVPMEAINYSSKQGKGDNKNHVNQFNIPLVGKKDTILIVDDICDSGNTLKEVTNFYEQFCNVQTASLFYKNTAVVTPTYYWQEISNEDGWIHFPWEGNLKHHLTPSC